MNVVYVGGGCWWGSGVLVGIWRDCRVGVGSGRIDLEW